MDELFPPDPHPLPPLRSLPSFSSGAHSHDRRLPLLFLSPLFALEFITTLLELAFHSISTSPFVGCFACATLTIVRVNKARCFKNFTISCKLREAEQHKKTMISSLLRCVVCSCCFLSTVHHASASAFRPILSSLPPTRQLYATASLSPLSSAPACSSKHTAQPPDSIIGTSLLLPVRGGLIEPKPPQQVSSWSKTQAAFLDILPASRLHFSLILFATLVHLAGLPAPALFSLDFSKIFTQLQLWRPLTAVAYLGPPSMSWANHLYFLLKFGQALEQSTGTATHMWFLLVQATLLSALGRYHSLSVWMLRMPLPLGCCV